MKRFLSCFLTLALCLSLLPVAGLAEGTDEAVRRVTSGGDPHPHNLTAHPSAAPAGNAAGSAAYWVCETCGKTFADENGENEIEIVTVTCCDSDGGEMTVDAVKMTSDLTLLSNYYYAVTEDVAMDDYVQMAADVILILCDGATMTAPYGIYPTNDAEEGALLGIYGQTNGTGTLSVTGVEEVPAIGCHYFDLSSGNVVISGSNGILTDVFYVEGGALTITDSPMVGILAGSVYILGGEVNVSAQTGGAGIRINGNGGGNVIALDRSDGGGDSVTVSSYEGPVTLKKPFQISGTATVLPKGGVSDNSVINGKTLIQPDAYDIILSEDIPDGRVSADVSQAFPYDTVTLTVTPGIGWALAEDGLTVTWTDGSNGPRTVQTARGAGNDADKYAFTMPAGEVTVSTAFEKAPVSYLTWDEESKAMKTVVVNDRNYIPVTANDTSWSSTDPNTYFTVSSPITNENRIVVSGTVNLILGDTLIAKKGITVTAGSTLNIYDTVKSTGVLYAGTDGASVTCKPGAAGIGGDFEIGADGGTIVINSGTVIAAGAADDAGSGGAGIGGSAYGDCGNVTINCTAVTATGSGGGAGIGGGILGNGGNVTVNCGRVTATGSARDGGNGMGIGAGSPSAGRMSQGALTLGDCTHLYGDNTSGSTFLADGTGGTYDGDRYRYMVVNDDFHQNNNGSSGGGGGGGAAASPVSVPDSAAAAGSHGTVKSSAASARAGDKVTLTLIPDEGYEAAGVTVTDAKGNQVTVTKNPDGTYSFTMPASAVTVTPVFEEITAPDSPGGDVSDRFTDVSRTAWYHDAVQWAVDQGLMNGVSDTLFAPNGTATRAMVVTMLWRLAGEPVVDYLMPYTDVSQDAWYAEAIRWAASAGAVNGTSETAFSPNAPVTREQLAAILYRYAQARGQGFTGSWMFLLDYPDADQVSDWADEAMHWMVMHGVITGMGDGTLAPKAEATRAQIAAMFMRFCEELEK